MNTAPKKVAANISHNGVNYTIVEAIPGVYDVYCGDTIQQSNLSATNVIDYLAAKLPVVSKTEQERDWLESNTYKYALKELTAAGYADKDSDYGGMLVDAVMKMLQVFHAEGHSGMSASIARHLFNQLSDWKPLSPLTGKDDEWNDVGDGVFQNKRCSTVFKQINKNGDNVDYCYNIEGRVFIDLNGAAYTNSESRVEVTFPYTVPEKPEYVYVNEDGNPLKSETSK